MHLFFSPSSLAAGILTFLPPGMGSYSMRATASYSYEGLVAAALIFVMEGLDLVWRIVIRLH